MPRHPDTVDLATAARLCGISRRTLRRRIREAELPSWHDPADRRRRLLHRDTLDQLLQPRLVTGKQGH